MLTLSGLNVMKRQFKIKHLLLLMLVVSVGLFLHLGLKNITSALENDIADGESSLHVAGKQKMTSEFPAMMDTAYGMTVDNVALKTEASIFDYFLFRRTIQCTYNLNVDYMRRELAHSRIPQERWVVGHYIDVPTRYQSRQSASVTVTPFGYKLDKQ